MVLIAGGEQAGSDADKHEISHPRSRKNTQRYPIGKVGSDSSFLCAYQKWHTDTVHEIDMVKAQKMGLKIVPTFSYAVVHFGSIPAECMATVVGHGQTISCERPSDATLNDPAIQADVRASGTRLLDKDQEQKWLDLIRSCVSFIFQSPTKHELTKEPFQCQEKGEEVDERTEERHREQGHTGITEVGVVDEVTQCEVCDEHNGKGKYFWLVWIIFARITSRKRRKR